MAPSSSSSRGTWDHFRGQAARSNEALNSDNLAEEQALLDEDDDGFDDEEQGRARGIPGRRRSSVTNRLAAMADIGGPNSFRSFARSWQRAASFAEVIPRRPSFVFSDRPAAEDDGGHDTGHGIEYGRSPVEAPSPQSGLLSQHLESTAGTSRGAGVRPSASQDFRARESKQLDAEMAAASGALPATATTASGATPSSRSSFFAAPPHLSSPSVIGSYGSYRSSQYGTMGSATLRPRRISVRRASMAAGQDADGATAEDEEEETALGEDRPILIKEIKQGDKVVLTVDGQSTLPQSVFNAINAIIGVGLLSLPLAFKMSGWLLGLGILTLTAAVTAHTADLLARCMRYDVSLITYSDLAYVSFGTRARVVVSALFTLELVAACVALVILFADSLALLFPSVGSATVWKCVCAALILVLNALPLRWLSYTSVIGIFSTFCIVCIIVVDGVIKKESPGSLWQPATTYLLPSNWLSLPLAYGLMASPWGAHSVFPSIYRDMRHPSKWPRAVHITFSFSYVLDTCLAVIGILMFGDGIREAITSNILKTAGYPESLTLFMCACVAVIPLTKIPLSARPLVTTADILCNLHDAPLTPGPMSWGTWVARAAVRVAVVLLLLLISIVFPAFDSVCAFLGAALCTLISVVLPIAFYLKLFWHDISSFERVVSCALAALFSAFGLVGTVWTFLPKELVGA